MNVEGPIMKRLTGRGKDCLNQDITWIEGHIADPCTKICEEADCECSRCDIFTCMEKLCSYENAEEEGRLIILPYGLGTTLYGIEVNCDNPENINCNHSSDCYKCEDANLFICECQISTIDQAVSLMRDWGETLFATHEEAETKLKELESIV